MYHKCHIIVTIGSNSPFFTWDFFVSQSVWKSRQRKNPQNGQNDWQKGLEGCTRIMFQIQCRWKSYMHRNDKLRCCMRGGGGHLYKRILLDPKTSKKNDKIKYRAFWDIYTSYMASCLYSFLKFKWYIQKIVDYFDRIFFKENSLLFHIFFCVKSLHFWFVNNIGNF